MNPNFRSLGDFGSFPDALCAMLQVVNTTPFVAELMLFPDEKGVDCVYAVVKATFDIAPRLAPAAQQVPFVWGDQHWGDPATTSLRYANEATLLKPATDVSLVGHAHAPAGGPATQVDVSLRVGSLFKKVRVFGDREWTRGLLTSATAPRPFAKVPLVYERAFGGTDASRPPAVDAEPRNPVGTGFFSKKTSLPTGGMRLPNLEDPAQLIGSPKDRPTPAGFGPVAGHWEPRRSFAGTYDEAWQKGRAPYLPADFNSRYFNSAAPGLVVPGFLSGGEAVEMQGVSPQGPLTFKLPKLNFRVTFTIAGTEHEKTPNLDTVIFEPDENRFMMLWRTAAVCDKQNLKVHQFRVDCVG